MTHQTRGGGNWSFVNVKSNWWNLPFRG